MNIDELEDLDDIELSDEEDQNLEASLRNVIEDTDLKWIFVGGKGGVGKTTMSSSIAVQLAARRKSVLIISTDPAHNLSDAFTQKFTSKPTPIEGFDNLFGMEIEPKMPTESALGENFSKGPGASIFQSILPMASSMPGVDEFFSFIEIMKEVKNMNYDVVVFDTAPTGHTLRLLSFPDMFENGFGKILKQSNVQNMMKGVMNMMGSNAPNVGEGEDGLNIGGLNFNKVTGTIREVSDQFKNPKLTTFVCVCIPEFLSVYETERLVQELMKFEIDSHNIIVNQLVFKDPERKHECKMCNSRVRIQRKYLNQVFELYSHFHITQMPLLGEEVRGPKSLSQFSKQLLTPLPYAYPKGEFKDDEE